MPIRELAAHARARRPRSLRHSRRGRSLPPARRRVGRALARAIPRPVQRGTGGHDARARGADGLSQARAPGPGRWPRVRADRGGRAGAPPRGRRRGGAPALRRQPHRGAPRGHRLSRRGAMPLAEMRRALPCAVHEVFRIETCAQGLARLGLALRGVPRRLPDGAARGGLAGGRAQEHHRVPLGPGRSRLGGRGRRARLRATSSRG